MAADAECLAPWRETCGGAMESCDRGQNRSELHPGAGSGVRFGGIIPALITPYQHDGEVHERSLVRIVREAMDAGVDGFYVGGSTGEAFLLTYRERTRLFEIVVDEVAGACPVICHVGAVGTREAVELGLHARSCGADAVSAVPPFYYAFSLDEIKAHYIAIADAVELPLILYNFPALTGVTLDSATVGQLFAHPWISGIKHTSPDLYQLERMKSAHPGLSILNGHDEVFLASLALGADGAIGSTYNFMADVFIRMRRLYECGDTAGAYSLQQRANRIISTLQQVGVFRGIKHILEGRGIECGGCRAPFRTLTESERRAIDEVMQEAMSPSDREPRDG